MSTTLKMANGDIYLNPATGKPRTVSGPEKCAQDVGESLLTLLIPDKASRSSVYLSRAYGSEIPYIQSPIQYSGLVGEPLITKKIQETIDRLMQYQKSDSSSTPDERISKIGQLVVQQVNSTDFIFYLEVILESGNKLELQKMTPTSLDHLAIRTLFSDDRLPPRLN